MGINPLHSKKKKILNDGDVRRWYDNLAASSEMRADVSLGHLYRFSEQNQLTPKQLVQLARKGRKRFEDLLEDHVRALEARGYIDKKGNQRKYSPNYLGNVVWAVRSWMNRNDVELKRRISLKGYHKGMVYQQERKEERVPTWEEMEQLFHHTPRTEQLRAKVSASFVAFAGLRPESLGNYHGEDGLTLADLPDVAIEGKTVFKEMPIQVIVRAPLSKAGHQYFNFMGEYGCQFLKLYFDTRLRKGEEFTPDSPVISCKEGYQTAGLFPERGSRDRWITTYNINREIRGLIRSAGFDWRPYLLRHYHDSMLLLAESQGRIVKDFRGFFMGHRGDIEATYTLNHLRLPPAIMKSLRDSYKGCQEFLFSSSEVRVRAEYQMQLKDLQLKLEEMKNQHAREVAEKDEVIEAQKREREEYLSGDVRKFIQKLYEQSLKEYSPPSNAKKAKTSSS